MNHPAKFNDIILANIDSTVNVMFDQTPRRILDPFGGVGRLKEIFPHAICLDIEPEWARESGLQADATKLPFADKTFQLVVTSPTYGNRMADHHKARDKSKRITYTHMIGHDLHDNNTGKMQFGNRYIYTHQIAWREVARVIEPFGIFILNIKNHIRKGEIVEVIKFHAGTIKAIGFQELRRIPIPVEGMRFGQNHELRIDKEWLIVFMRNEK